MQTVYNLHKRSLMSKIYFKCKALLVCGALLMFGSRVTYAQKDSLHVLSYNVLYLGDTPPCQDGHAVSEGYIETVIAYANPDIAGFEKMEAIPAYTGDMSGNAPAAFADSILQYIFNAAYPGRYAYCPFTNTSGANNISMLFYNQQKLGFAGILSTYVNITDFTTYKLYYKTPSLAITHDSIFLYVTLNHTNSGSGSSDASTRADQISGELAHIETHFSSLPNMINMGDFNTHTTTEACYQTLVAPANTNYRFYDPPFYPDATFAYPANWDSNPADFASCLTVSTRIVSAPNACSGNTGGGKSWYDHIFLSAKIINNADRISYVPHSFRVIGNDGNRVGAAVNGSPTNTSAPAAVINAIYQVSEHYPVTVSLLVDTSATASVPSLQSQGKVMIVNPVAASLILRFTPDQVGKPITITCTDAQGKVQMKKDMAIQSETVQLPCPLSPGMYYLKIVSGNSIIADTKFVKE